MPKILQDYPTRIGEKGGRYKLITKNFDAGKNDEYQGMELRKKIANWYLNGLSQCEIADKLGCSQGNISYHLKKVREIWLAEMVTDYDQIKAQELARIDNLEQVAWRAFHRSCEDAETHHEEETQSLRLVKDSEGNIVDRQMMPTGTVTKKTSRGQTGDPRFLERIQWCIEQRCKILGVNKETPTSVNQLIINFDQLYSRPDFKDDPVEKRIAEVKQLATTKTNGKGSKDES